MNSPILDIVNGIPDENTANRNEEPSSVDCAMDATTTTTTQSERDYSDCDFKIAHIDQSVANYTTNDLHIQCISLNKDETDSEADAVNHSTTQIKNRKTMYRKAKTKLKNKCLRCRRIFKSKNELMHHLDSYHAKGITKTISCYLCKKVFARKNNFIAHMNSVHLGTERFSCSFAACSKSYRSKIDLKRHINAKHTKETVLKCTHCPKEFYRQSHLDVHQKSKHNRCDLCKKHFSSKPLLLKHVALCRTGFKCPVCSRKFASNVAVRIHMNVKQNVCGQKMVNGVQSKL